MQAKTKSAVIAEAARIIATHHPNQRSYLSRWETWRTAFDWLCRDIPENQTLEAAKTIVGYVQHIWRKSANRSEKDGLLVNL
ncbi:MAG: hypothetical protein HC773_23240 [Scytonema sp. CRU_2_7]|nr:hypothetical protein [Scytonema sp. CRU_2_7]